MTKVTKGRLAEETFPLLGTVGVTLCLLPPLNGPHTTEEHRGLHRCLLHERTSHLLGWLLLARFPRALHHHLLLHLGTHPEGVTSYSPLGKLLSLVNIPVHSQ